ncbi:hypothetical protein [Microvirga puerhi]|uniref:Bartonella effector protein BID domain-containing protein n=1 Tax=Microvirga puerhi TaxID=2876078 RepID=A0ABS7VTF4_9HYPH|nr:hypothetical protein [Microvirga puerhi]MBZ6078846.1 hypothetical protein [Microvirga puerhi]
MDHQANQSQPAESLIKKDNERWLVPPSQPVLDPAAITERLNRSEDLARKGQEIRSLSDRAYGPESEGAIAKVIERLNADSEPARLSYRMAEQLREQPETLGVLRGRPGGPVTPESAERGIARAAIERLPQAIQDYGYSVGLERQRISMDHSIAEERGRVGVLKPSSELRNALEAQGPLAKKLLNEIGNKGELRDVSRAFENRLSHEDQVALKAGNVSQVAKGLRIDERAASEVVKTYSQVKSAIDIVEGRKQEIRQDRSLSR